MALARTFLVHFTQPGVRVTRVEPFMNTELQVHVEHGQRTSLHEPLAKLDRETAGMLKSTANYLSEHGGNFKLNASTADAQKALAHIKTELAKLVQPEPATSRGSGRGTVGC